MNASTKKTSMRALYMPRIPVSFPRGTILHDFGAKQTLEHRQHPCYLSAAGRIVTKMFDLCVASRGDDSPGASGLTPRRNLGLGVLDIARSIVTEIAALDSSLSQRTRHLSPVTSR